MMMKGKKNILALGAAALLTFSAVLTGCGSSSGGSSAGGSYTTSYDITGDYMTEDPDTGALTVESYPETPMNPDDERASSVAIAYAAGFGSFVDAVSMTATLKVDGDSYTYTIKDQCGTEENAMGYYAPEFSWSGEVTSQEDGKIAVAAPTAATITIASGGQFATNAEMTGYFGEDGYTADETTTDCPYTNILAGDALLSAFVPGTFTVDGSAITGFTAD